MRYMFTRRMGPVGIALTAFDVWRRIPPRHRRRIIAEARRHGPRIAKAAVAGAAARRRRRRPRRPR
jgi:hypothetical protein